MFWTLGRVAAASGSTIRATITFMNRGGRETFAVHDKVVAAFMEPSNR
jgi:hypothetical protein